MPHIPLKTVEDFMRRHGMSARRMGVLACNDSRVVERYRLSGDLTLHMSKRITDFMANYDAKPEKVKAKHQAVIKAKTPLESGNHERLYERDMGRGSHDLLKALQRGHPGILASLGALTPEIARKALNK